MILIITYNHNSIFYTKKYSSLNFFRKILKKKDLFLFYRDHKWKHHYYFFFYFQKIKIKDLNNSYYL